jgi:hypothetical protein
MYGEVELFAAINVVLVSSRAAERDDVAVRVFNVEILRAPRRHFQRLEDLGAISDTLFVECFDAVDSARGIEVLVFPTMLALRRILGRFFQMQFQSIQTADSVESAPGLTETETQRLVVRDRALKVVDEELRSERSDTRLGLVRHFFLRLLEQFCIKAEIDKDKKSSVYHSMTDYRRPKISFAKQI